MTADDRQQLAAFDHAVELVTVQHQQAAAVGGGMDGFALDRDVAEGHAGVIAQQVVVVAGYIDDAGTVLGFGEQGANDVVVFLRPIDAAAHMPEIDDVADQVKRFAFRGVQEVEKIIRPAHFAAEVYIGYPDGAEALRLQLAKASHVAALSGGTTTTVMHQKGYRELKKI